MRMVMKRWYGHRGNAYMISSLMSADTGAKQYCNMRERSIANEDNPVIIVCIWDFLQLPILWMAKRKYAFDIRNQIVMRYLDGSIAWDDRMGTLLWKSSSAGSEMKEYRRRLQCINISDTSPRKQRRANERFSSFRIVDIMRRSRYNVYLWSRDINFFTSFAGRMEEVHRTKYNLRFDEI